MGAQSHTRTAQSHTATLEQSWGFNSDLSPCGTNPAKNRGARVGFQAAGVRRGGGFEQEAHSWIVSPGVGVGFLFHKCHEKNIIVTVKSVGLRGIPF